MHRPPLLGPGARVALVAPAGPLSDEADLTRAIDNAHSFGFEVEVGAHAMARDGYFAGSDAERLGDLNRAIADAHVDAIWCIRGGYGAMRLLDGIDYAALKRRPKAVVGYSDITALHAAISNRCDVVTYHGPTARAELTNFSRRSLEHALVRGGDSCGSAKDATTLVPGTARGRLAGGNLALLSALCGTPYFPNLDGAILVLEDVNEAVYRIDRMLVQLQLAGVLQSCVGIAFGAFTHADEEEGTGGARSLSAVLEETARAMNVPCIAGIPVGHIPDQWTIPIGAVAELNAETKTLTVL